MTIPIEPFDDEPAPANTLGPAGLEDAMHPLEAILGELVTVFLRDDVDATSIAMPLVPVPAGRLVALLPTIATDRPGTLLVSDGNMSHALGFMGAQHGRIVFYDPWNSSSFLQAGRNVAGVEARAEGAGRYSVTPAELERVIVAQGVAGLGKQGHLVTSPTWVEFAQSEFYKFFGLRPQGERLKLSDGYAVPHLPGGFREFVSLDFEVDAGDRLRAGVLEVQHEWLLGAGRYFGMDLLKSFVNALVVRIMDLTDLGVAHDADVPCPDVHLTDALVSIFWSIGNGQGVSQTALTDRLMPLLGVVAGQREEAYLQLHYHGIRFVNRGGIVLVRIERVTP